MNKMHLINKALTADLKPIMGKMLAEFIMRADENGFSHVGAERLCKVRGIRHTKNFPWKELHDLSDVLTIKLGRDLTPAEIKQVQGSGKTVYGDKNYFWIKPEAIMSLGDFQVTKSVKPKAAARAKHPANEGVSKTPANEGYSSKTPATAGYKHPASAELSTLQVQTQTPASAGCNSSKEILQEESTSSSSNTATPVVLRFKEDSFPTLFNVEGSKVTYFLNSEGVTKVEDAQEVSNSPKSDSPTALSSKDAVALKEHQQGREYLEVLVKRNRRMTTQDAAAAYALYDDESWKPEKTGGTRAAAAEAYAFTGTTSQVKEAVGNE